MDIDITLIPLLLLLALLVGVLNRVLFQPLLTLLQRREALTTGLAAEARRLQAQADRDGDTVTARLRAAHSTALAQREQQRKAGRDAQRQLLDGVRRQLSQDNQQLQQRLESTEKQTQHTLAAKVESMAESLYGHLIRGKGSA